MEPNPGNAEDAFEDGGLVVVEFDVGGTSYPFVRASEVESCTFDLVEMVRRDDGGYSEYFEVEDTDPARVREVARNTDNVEAYLLRETADSSLFEFVVEGGCVAVSLADLGGIPRVVRGVDGEGTIKAELPRANAQPIVEQFLERHDDVDLVARDVDEDAPPVFTDDALREAVDEELTLPQREAMLGAFSRGYYDWPTRTTTQEIARTLGLSNSQFTDRLHAAERKLLSVLFNRRAVDDSRAQPLTDSKVEASDED